MRSCIYCGKELEKGEVCNCAQSTARRQSKTADNGQNTDSSYSTNYGTGDAQYSQTSYRTGYTKKESRIKRAWERFKMKRAIKRTYRNNVVRTGLWEVVKRFIKSPVETIMNPPYIGMGAMVLIAALQGMFTWLCVYFIMNNVRRGIFTALASLMSFYGIQGYTNLVHIAMAAISGAVAGIILFFIYTGIFYFINRVIFRMNTDYRSFSQRLVLAGIPMTVIAIIGTLFSFLEQTTLLIFLCCGVISWVVLTYEALRAEWMGKSYGKIMYAMLGGVFVFFSIICYLVMLA